MRRHTLIAAALVAVTAIVVPAASGVTLDQAPQPTITSRPNAQTNTTHATFEFTDSDPLATFECRVDGVSEFSPCLNPYSFDAPSDGTYTFEVRAVDIIVGDPSEPATYTWTVDTVAPDDPSIAGPANPTSQQSAAFTFSAGGASSFACSLDGGDAADCSGGSASYPGPLTEGAHTFTVVAFDPAGNSSSSAYPWTIDLTPPLPPVIQDAPTDPTANTGADFTFSAGDGTTTSYQCQLDGGAASPCTSGVHYSDLDDGPHTFSVRGLDSLGHVSDPATYSWTVDTLHPLVTISEKPPLLTNRSSASFTFSAASGATGYQCSLDGIAFASCSSPTTYESLPDGAHTFGVRSVSAGHTPGAATKYTWQVDTVAPQTTLTSTPPSSSTTTTATFAFASTESSSSFFCSLNGSGFVPCTSPKTYNGLGDGNQTFGVQAVDQAGNVDTSAATYSWQIRGVGPPTQDFRPPANVRNARRNVGYGRLQLHWRNPADADFDHVAVFVSTKRSAPPRTVVYSGRSQTYTNKRFKNGLYYRYLIVSFDRAENAAGGTRVTVPPSVLLKGPGDGRVVHRPPLLRWTPVRRATFYNVQLYFHGEKVLSTWPAKPRRQLSRRWTYGRRFALRRGAYVWYVWPGFGPRAKSHYGQLLGQGTFKMR